MLFALLGLAHGPTDEELVRRFQSGDLEAYGDLVQRYQDRIFTLCLRWMHNRSIAEEVAQDVFLAAYRALDRFRGDAKFSTWLFRIAVNHCKNRKLYRHRRAQGRHEPLEGLSPDGDGPKRQIAAEGPGTDEGVHRSEAGKILELGLAELDEDFRSIIVLRDIDGLAYEEIADILDLPKGTVKSRLHRARAQLAKILSRTLSAGDFI